MKSGSRFLQFLAAGVVLGVGGWLTADVARAADGIVLADHIPADASFVISSSSLSQACRAFEATGLGAEATGPDFTQLVSELRRLDQAAAFNLRAAFGFDWADVAKIEGGAALAVFPLKDGSVGSAWLFASGRGAPSNPPAALAAAAAHFASKGYGKSTSQRGGVNLTILTPPASAKSKTAPVLLSAKDFHGVVNSQAAADALLAVQADKSLLHSELYQSVAKSLAGDGNTALFFIRPIELWELIDDNEKPAVDAKRMEGGLEMEQVAPVEQARRLGFDAVRAIAGRLQFKAAQPCQWEIRSTIVAPRPYRSAMRMLSLEPGPALPLPPWIGADVASAWFWRWDFSLAIKGYGNWFDEANQPGPDGEGLFEDMIDGLRDDPEGVKVDLRRDVFAQLKPEVIRVAAGGNPGANEQEQGWLLVAGVGDMATVQQALTQFYRGDDRVTHERLADYDLWTVPEGASLFVEGQSTSVVTIRALAVGGGRLMFGTDLELLKAAVRQNPPTVVLAKDSQWSSLLGWLDQNATAAAALRGLARLDQSLETSYQQAIADTPEDDREAMTDLWRLLLFGTTEPTAELRSAAPKFESIRAGLPPAGILMSQTDAGWTFDLGVLPPKTQ